MFYSKDGMNSHLVIEEKERESERIKIEHARYKAAIEEILEIDEYRKRVGGPRTGEADIARKALLAASDEGSGL